MLLFSLSVDVKYVKLCMVIVTFELSYEFCVALTLKIVLSQEQSFQEVPRPDVTQCDGQDIKIQLLTQEVLRHLEWHCMIYVLLF